MTIPYVSTPGFRVSILTTYSTLLLVAIACGIFAARRLARRFGIPQAEIVWLSLSLVVIALVGGRTRPLETRACGSTC